MYTNTADVFFSHALEYTSLHLHCFVSLRHCSSQERAGEAVWDVSCGLEGEFFRKVLRDVAKAYEAVMGLHRSMRWKKLHFFRLMVSHLRLSWEWILQIEISCQEINVLFYVFFIPQFTSSCRPTAHTLALSWTIGESIDMQVSSSSSSKSNHEEQFQSCPNDVMTMRTSPWALQSCDRASVSFISLQRDQQITTPSGCYLQKTCGRQIGNTAVSHLNKRCLVFTNTAYLRIRHLVVKMC